MAALLVSYLGLQRKGSILAIDADPNSCFADALGVSVPQTIVGVCEEISKNMDKIPAGMTKDRHIEMRVQETIIEGDRFDLLVMGRPEGPGCYCYVNNLLRGVITEITNSYDYIVIDNAAGMEHISRRTMGNIQKLVIVSDYSVSGVRAAKRIYELVNQLGMKFIGAYLVVNKVSGSLEPLKDEIRATGLDMIGDISYNEQIISWNIAKKSMFDFEDAEIDAETEEVFENILR